MSQTLEKPAPMLTPAIRRRLGHLRAVIRRRLAAEGLAWLVLSVVAAAALTFVVDYGLYWLTRQHTTVGQRLLILLGCLVGIGFVGWRSVIRPQLVKISDDDLALIVERAHPELADRLISALQFARMEDLEARGASPELVARMAEQANAMAGAVRFTAALRAGRIARDLSIAAVALLLVAGAAAARPALARTWLHRVALLQDLQYPRSTMLRIDGPTRIRVGRGSALTIAVAADRGKVVPPEVTFHMKFPSVGNVDEAVPPTAEAADRFEKKFELVNEPFTFFVTGNDDATGPVSVEVAEPPQLRDVSFTILAPEYTHQRAQTITGAQGTLTVPLESTVVVTATATKDLKSATLLLDGAPAGTCQIAPVEDAGAKHPRGVQVQFKLAAPKPFKPAINLRFALEDAEGFASSQGAQYTLMLQPDKPPAVQIATAGISGQISTRAMIPIVFTAKDDYGLRAIDLEWALMSAGEKRTRIAVRRLDPDEPELKPYTHVLDLQQLAPPATAPAGPPASTQPSPVAGVGESIRLVGLATDTLPAPDGPNVSFSNPITLKIVSDEELLAAMVDSQRSLREQFRQAMTAQAEAKGKTDAGVERAREKDGLSDAQRLAGESADQQQQINDRTAAMAARFDEILLQLANNRIGADADKRRLKDKIITPLRDLVGGAMKQIAIDLAAAKSRPDAETLATELTRLAAAQDKVRAQMDAILGEMVKVENAQQVEHGLKVIIDMTQRVHTLTGSQRKQEPTTQPK